MKCFTYKLIFDVYVIKVWKERAKTYNVFVSFFLYWSGVRMTIEKLLDYVKIYNEEKVDYIRSAYDYASLLHEEQFR